MVERGELTEGHARAVLAVPDHDGRRRLARRIVQQGLSVRAAERAARWAGGRAQAAAPPPPAGRIRRSPSGHGGVERLTGVRARVAFAAASRSRSPTRPSSSELAEALERVVPPTP